jgi:hypothetical protein
MMLGLGETNEQVLETMQDLVDVGVEVLNLGQYLRPSKRHLPVMRWVTPEEFDMFKERGEAIDLRMSDADKTLAEFRALALQESGSNNAEILRILNDEFEQAYIINDIPLLIRSAKQKSLRQGNVS